MGDLATTSFIVAAQLKKIQITYIPLKLALRAIGERG